MKSRKTSFCFAATLVAVCVGSAQAQDLASIENAPNLKSSVKPQALGASLDSSSAGQCYARVSIPAVYRTESVKVEVRPELARFKITPPVFKDASESVTITPAVTKITPVQPVLETRVETLEVLASTTQWVRDSEKSKMPLTAGELEELKGAGIDTANVATGSCFYEYFSDAIKEDIPTKVMVSEATEKLSVTDAVLEEKRVTVTIVPPHTRMIEVPPSFKNGTEKVMVTSATKAWKTECGAVQQLDHMTGETLCLVDVPAEFETLDTKVPDIPALITNVDEAGESKQVTTHTLVSDATEAREAVPAKFDLIDRQRIAKPAHYSWLAKNVKPEFGAKATGRAACYVKTPAKMAEYEREVVKTAGRFEIEKVPAKTETFKVKQLVSKALSKQVMEKPEIETVQRKILVEDAKIEWQPVLCQIAFSDDIIVQLQKALKREGFEPGPIDGVMGRGTSRALQEYQKANKLADGGVTIEAMKKLGIEL